MEVFVQQLINGLTLGSIYGLIAIGYTMVFGIIGMVNFAHGDVFMVGAFIALIFFLFLTTWFGWALIPALILVLIPGPRPRSTRLPTRTASSRMPRVTGYGSGKLARFSKIQRTLKAM